MKKILTLLMAVSLLGLSGCGDDPVNGGTSTGGGDVTPDPDPKPGVSTLTPGEHQKKLEDIAKEFVSCFDAEDHRLIAESVAALCSYIEEDDYDVIGYSHYVSVGIDGSCTAILYGVREGSNPRIVEKPDFVTSATLSMNNGYFYELDIKVDLNKMSLTSGAVQGFIGVATSDGMIQVAVAYDKQFYEWGAYQNFYYDYDGKGNIEIVSPYLRSHISEITLKTYAKDGYFTDMSLSKTETGVSLDITVNRSVAGSDKGRIEFYIGGNAVYAVDAMCYTTRSAASLLSETGVLSMLRGVASGEEGGVVTAVTRASAPDYSYTLNEYKGTAYVYDNDKEEWVETSIDGNKVSLSWDDAQVIVSWTDSNKKWTGNVDFDQTAEISLPGEIKVSMTIAGKEHIALTVTPDLTDNYTVGVKATCTINGGYALSVDAKADRKGASAAVVLAKGDRKLATARGSVLINDATDSDNWFEMNEYRWTDSYGVERVERETYCVLDEYIEDNVKTGEFTVDILAASIYAKGDFRKIITDAKAIEDTESKAGAQLLAGLINANATSFLYYNDTNDKVADVVSQPYMSDYWSYDGSDYEYWDQEPILVFPDGSKFAFEDYFTSKKFSSLIDAVEDLFDAYAKIAESK